jgi:hypothetical protein
LSPERPSVARSSSDSKAIVVADRNVVGAEGVAKAFGGLATACDVGNEADIPRVRSGKPRRTD